jgi:hypothetical protein
MSGPIEKKAGKKKHGKRSRKLEQVRDQKLDKAPSERPEPLQSHRLEQPQIEQPDQLQARTLDKPPTEKQEPLQTHKLAQPQIEQPDQLRTKTLDQLESQKPDQLRSQKPEPRQDGNKPCDTAIASENAHSIDFQTLATAYGNYTKKSFEETKAFVEKLSGVRSLDKVVEIQTEFAKQAYETFVTESQKIRELYRGLAKQNLKPFEGFIAKKTKGTR